MNYAVGKLEFSVDPLSDTTPAWTDITRYCQGMSWFGGVSKDTDSPEAGGATFILKNMQRRFEPEYTAGAYYPNIVPGRRFRITVTADGVARAQGVYFAREWKVEYPDPSLGYSTVTVACGDGFWRLANDTTQSMTPANAETYDDVITADNPLAYFPLAEEAGGTLEAVAGNSGSYKGGLVEHAKPNPVLGDPGFAARFPANSATYARSKLDDVSVFNDSTAFTAEGVATLNGTSGVYIATGPWRTADSEGIFNLHAGTGSSGTRIRAGGNNSFTGSTPSTGTHHYALTCDGSSATFYIDGAAIGTIMLAGALATPDANDFVYIGGTGHAVVTGTGHIISHVAFYDYALTAAQIAQHSTAALTLGYPAQTAGTRIAALATDPLWSTAGIPAGTVTVAATPQHGQAVIDEITAAHSTESPGSVFYFNDAGNPAYQGLMDTWTPAATFGDLPSEVNYTSIDLAYDDDLFNTATVSGPGLDGATATNAQSLADYGNRGIDQSNLPITTQQDARLLAQAYVDRFATPAFRIESISLTGQDQDSRTQILTREIGDVIRVKRRGDGGTPIDIITRILRKEKSLDPNGDLRCVWGLARGFNASLAQWHLSTTGFGELGQTTTLA